eukprot:10572311-Alexandrium_andersonii.AAC.1
MRSGQDHCILVHPRITWPACGAARGAARPPEGSPARRTNHHTACGPAGTPEGQPAHPQGHPSTQESRPKEGQ